MPWGYRMPDNSTRRAAAILCCLLYLTVCSAVFAQDKASDAYPEHGKVIANTVSAKSTARGVPVFRVETDTRVYEFEGNNESKLAVGDTIQFRIENDSAYVRQGDKEQTFKVIDTQLKDDD